MLEKDAIYRNKVNNQIGYEDLIYTGKFLIGDLNSPNDPNIINYAFQHIRYNGGVQWYGKDEVENMIKIEEIK